MEQLTVEITPDEVVAGDLYVSTLHTFVLLGDTENGNSNTKETIYGSGKYYGKDDPATDVEPLDHDPNAGITIHTNSKEYKIARWKTLDGIPINTPIVNIQLEVRVGSFS